MWRFHSSDDSVEYPAKRDVIDIAGTYTEVDDAPRGLVHDDEGNTCRAKGLTEHHDNSRA